MARWTTYVCTNPDCRWKVEATRHPGHCENCGALVTKRLDPDRSFVNAREEIEDEDGNTRPMTPDERRAWEER